LRQPVVLSLFAVCFLIQASHGPYYGFFSIYLEDQGLSRTVIGGLWALGVVAEVLVFLLMHRLLPRFGARRLMLATLALTVLRWLLIGWGVSSMVALVVAQCLHAFSFGLYHAVAIFLINRFFRGRVQGRGQALYSSLSFGAGGSLGALLGGQAWGSLGPQFTFTAAALVAAVGWVIAWLGLRPERFTAPVESMA
jgi:PPP family 3-phenylpropionic acid transporter